jgi:hypothetical protein
MINNKEIHMDQEKLKEISDKLIEKAAEHRAGVMEMATKSLARCEGAFFLYCCHKDGTTDLIKFGSIKDMCLGIVQLQTELSNEINDVTKRKSVPVALAGPRVKIED